MKTVIRVIASETGQILDALENNANPELAAELLELLALYEQLTGTSPPNISDDRIARIIHSNLGLDDEISGGENLLIAKEIQDGDHPHPVESYAAA